MLAYRIESRSACGMNYINCCEIGEVCMYHSHGSTFMSLVTLTQAHMGSLGMRLVM